LPSSHTTGRASEASRSSGRAANERPALGALHRDPLRRQLAQHQRDEGQRERDEHDRDRLGGRAEEAQWLVERAGQGYRGRGGGEEAGQRDADLDGGQEAVRVPGQPGQHAAARRAALQPLDLALSQGDHGHLAAGESTVDEDQDEHQQDLAPVAAHGQQLLVRGPTESLP
jgi:hypothetical protein